MAGYRAVTIREVARLAQVSITTASDALAGRGRVSASTRDAVHAAARQLGYSVNHAARSLRSGRHNAIGVYLPQRVIGLDYYMHFVGEIVRVAHENGLTVALLAPQAHGDAVQAQVDGIVMIDPILGDLTVERMLAAGVPVVSGEPYLGGSRAPDVTIMSDHQSGLQSLLGHLQSRGAKAPAFIAPKEDSFWARTLRSTYLEYCGAAGIPARLREIPTDTANAAGTVAVAESLLTQSSPPDCLVAGPDGAALAALGAAQKLGLRVGDELLIAACVDSATLTLCNPPITGLDLDPRALARSCARELVNVLQGKAVEPVIPHPVTLRERASTRGREAGATTHARSMGSDSASRRPA